MVNEAVSEARDPNAQFKWVHENGGRMETFHSAAEGEAWMKENDQEGVLWKAPCDPPAPKINTTRRSQPNRGAAIASCSFEF
jgi:hypothetical protein